MHIGKRFKQVRKKLNLTQTRLAEVIGCKQATIADYERERISPSVKVLSIISENYNINLNWLLTGSGPMFQSDQSSYNNVPAPAREANRINQLEKELELLKKNISLLQAECDELGSQNKELNAQLINRLQELLDAKDLIYKTLS